MHHSDAPAEASTAATLRVVVVALPMSSWGLARLIDSSSVSSMVCVGVSSDAGAALAQMPALQPDVVVFDLDGQDSAEPLAGFVQQTQAKVLALTSSPHTDVHDRAVLAGARGVVDKRASPEVLHKAIGRVHAGEIWVDRNATGRIFLEMARQRAQTSDNPVKARFASLTPRQRYMLQAVVADVALPGKVLAQRLHISENTLRNHLSAIYDKLGVATRVELYALVQQHGLPDAR